MVIIARNKMYTFFVTVFGLFILTSLVTVLVERPIIRTFRSEVRDLQWRILLMSAALSAALLIFFAKGIKKHTFKIRTSLLLLILIGITALPRVISIHSLHVLPKGDFKLYYSLTSSLVKGEPVIDGYVALFPHVIGFPFVLSAFYRVFGSSVMVAQYLNVVLGCGIAILLFFLGKALSGRKCGFAAALLWALWPSQIFYTTLLATEPLYTLLLLLFLLLFHSAATTGKSFGQAALYFGLLGIFCCGINAIRPFGLIFLIALACYYLLCTRKNVLPNQKFSRKAALYGILVLSYLISFNGLTYILSSIGNMEIAKSPIGFNVYVGANLDSRGAWNSEDSKMLEHLMKEPGYTAQNVHSTLLKMGIERFKEHMSQNFFLLKEKFKGMWAEDYDVLWYIWSALDPEKPSPFNYEFYFKLLIKLCNYYYYTILLLCAYSGFRAIKSRQTGYIVLPCILVLGMAAVHLIVEVHGRYHYPAMALFALIASYGLFGFTKENSPKV